MPVSKGAYGDGWTISTTPGQMQGGTFIYDFLVDFKIFSKYKGTLFVKKELQYQIYMSSCL